MGDGMGNGGYSRDIKEFGNKIAPRYGGASATTTILFFPLCTKNDNGSILVCK